jgi:hypothetical protein
MLHANMDTLNLFRDTLSEHDKARLDEELTAFAKEFLHRELLHSAQERLRELLSQGKISPVVFQWALAVRDTYPPQMETAS